MKSFLVSIYSDQAKWGNSFRIVAEDAAAAQAEMQSRIDANRGYSMGTGGWYITDVEDLETAYRDTRTAA